MNWEKAGPACTEEQAVALTERLIGVFDPKEIRIPVLLEVWADEFKRWPYAYAERAVMVLIRTHDDRFKMPVPAEAVKLMNEWALRDQVERPR